MNQKQKCTMWRLQVMTRSRNTWLNQETRCHNVTKLYQKCLVTLLLSLHLQMFQAIARFIWKTRKSQLCEEYGQAFSKHNEDIGRTKLVKMDIDTGDSPPVSSRPYTLPLKHYEWVQRGIESLECVGFITKSMSNLASPIVIVPKKSAPGEPLKRRLCIDFRKVNELPEKVLTDRKTRGQISLHSLPRIDEIYVKLKGANMFSTIDLRSGYYLALPTYSLG